METFPPLQPNVKPLARQQDLLASVNRVQRERGAPPLPGLPALFDAEAQFVYAVPLLDPSAAHRARPGASAAVLAAGLERPAPGDVLKRLVERCLALIGET